MSTSANFNTPSAPSMFKEGNSGRYPELLSDSTNFRIKKIMDDEKMLQDEIKHRNSVCKKYGRYSSLTDGVEYTLILADIVIGTLSATIPGVGSVVSSATFSGVGLISGAAKLIQSRLNNKKLKHYRLSVIASTTLNNLHHKISKAIIDGQITHEEFEDIQNTMNEWKNGSKGLTKQQLTMSPETIELLSQQATEKAQKELLDQLKQINSKNLKK
ncbi:hypothetical protein IIV22_098L [Invertebrate iridescent virus 22]|uniref:Uncharacterized protein n=1 Tax=Invertebrate iridescent virus 22 TaxID=345198 RepID=S6DF61_9VIRU|nr:hypothetical protein IIV22_098L [Invertebrate iridescent virus 22]CCV01775.1 hypothetical protein IIV22_098L [Invertebrate iridescent virus 22]